ncbi:MAG TPA: hypothetical protein ENJ55_06110 [Rhizobiales bacterium]|nr:hypothetical protein [Hyphomicrobiales bacterium]
MNQASNGAFDPSIQPLWRLYANWFSAHPGSKGPPEKSLAAARELVNFNQIKIDDATIRLAAGQAISLNGIAQGYITDRISHMLKQAGWHHVLVNLGEYRAIDGKPDGSPFRLGLAGAQLETDLSDMALASTSPDGFVFPGSQNGSRNTTGHVIDPRTGITPQGWQTVHVRHRSAATADGLSTAFAILDTNAIQSVIKSFTGTTAWAVAPNGDVSRFQS